VKSHPPRTGTGADAPFVGLAGVGLAAEDAPPSTKNHGPTDTSHYEKKRKASIPLSEEEAARIYTVCRPLSVDGSRQIHKVLSDGEEMCVPEGSMFEDGGSRRDRGGSQPRNGSVEFYCPVPREGAPRPVVTGELVNPNVVSSRSEHCPPPLIWRFLTFLFPSLHRNAACNSRPDPEPE